MTVNDASVQVSASQGGVIWSSRGTKAGDPPASADALEDGLTSENSVTDRNRPSRTITDTCALNMPCAAEADWITGLAVFDDLPADQAYGHACVVCGGYFLDRALESIWVGISTTGGPVFACPDPCASADVEDGGLGFNPDNHWQGGRP